MTVHMPPPAEERLEDADRRPQARAEPPAPIGLLAELTHRCPLRCPYCSNPLDLERRSAELDTQTWTRVFQEAAALGILQVHLSGGEPTARADLVEIVRGCAAAGLYSNLITAGVGVARERLEGLAEAGLDHVQLSFQGADAATTDRVAGLSRAHERKLAFAADVRALGLPLTVNVVVHLYDEETRDFYALEYFWSEADRVTLPWETEQAEPGAS